MIPKSGSVQSSTVPIRRNPGLALLAGAQARPFLDESCSELRDVGLALLPLRTTSRLYEFWAALAAGYRQSVDTYVTCLQTNNPDYILRVERQERTAFAVGDAILGDPKHTSGITKKLGKVAGEYAENIIYLDAIGRPRACHLGTSFVFIPCAKNGPS